MKDSPKQIELETLLAEKQALIDLLANCPAENVLDRMSYQLRLNKISAKINSKEPKMNNKKTCRHCNAELLNEAEEIAGVHNAPEVCFAVLKAKIQMLEQIIVRSPVVTEPKSNPFLNLPEPNADPFHYAGGVTLTRRLGESNRSSAAETYPV